MFELSYITSGAATLENTLPVAQKIKRKVIM